MTLPMNSPYRSFEYMAEQRRYFGKKIADAIEEALLVPNHHQPGDKLCDACYVAQRAAIIARGNNGSI